MAINNPKNPVLQVNLGSFVTFVAAILLLIGIYTSIRTAINLAAYDKYPTVGVLSLNFFGMPPYMQREEDCFNPIPYYTNDGKFRQATNEEKEMEKNNQRFCVNSINAGRESTKSNDINTSLFFLFIGTGLLIVKKFLFPAK